MHRYLLASMAYGFTRTMYLSDSKLVTGRIVHSVVAGAISPWSFPCMLLDDVTNFEKYLRGMPMHEPTVFPVKAFTD